MSHKLKIPSALLPYVPILALGLVVIAFVMMGSALTGHLTRGQRSRDFVAHARIWADDWRLHHRRTTGAVSPWGGSYEVCQGGSFVGTTLVISGFREAGRAHCPEADQLQVQKEWDANPIPNAVLRFHFNGLPAVTLTKE